MKHRHLWKKVGALLLTCVLALTACNRETQKPESLPRYTVPTTVEGQKLFVSSQKVDSMDDSSWEPTTETTDIVPAEDDLAQELLSLPGVVKVGRKNIGNLKYDENQYLVYYEMPIDHNDPSKGTFTQRMYLNYKGNDAPNVFYIGGYNLYYGINDERETELAAKYNCNFFEPEYRFDGGSMPDGFSPTETDYWEYLNCAQASEDFHSMIEGLKTIFNGKWCIEGISKGGEFTVYQAGKHPEDADLYVAEAAMLKCNNGYPGLYEYMYTKAGDDTYGKDQAKEYRDMVLAFQVELIKNRDVLEERYWKEATEKYGMTFSSTFTKELLFDCTVLDLNYIWQFALEEEFESIKMTMEMKPKDGETDKTKQENFYSKAISTMTDLYGPWQYAVKERWLAPEEGQIYNYLFQCATEDGYYAYDFSYLRKALEKDGSGASLFVTEDMEKDLYLLRLDEKHQQTFPYNDEACRIRCRAVEETQKPLILVNPTTDVHYVAEIKESSNPNVHIFPVIGGGHGDAEISYLTEKQFQEYDQVVKQALGL